MMTLNEMIARLVALRDEHGGDLLVSVTDGDEDTPVKAEAVTVYETALSKDVMIDLTV